MTMNQRSRRVPSLRVSSFCGEALTEGTQRWQAAAPHSVGQLVWPTEATIAITAYRYGRDLAERGVRNGIVPIGWPLPHQEARVFDDQVKPAAPGSAGELYLAGSQLADGYWNDASQTAARFVPRGLPGCTPEGRTPADSTDLGTWFRTGDRVETGSDGCLHYLGRLDDQIKIRGFRVELSEIDEVLRRISGTQDALAVPWPSRDAAEAVFAAVGSQCGADPAQIRNECRKWLPDYMVPHRVVILDEIPRGPNGKLDRNRVSSLIFTTGAM